MIRHDERQLLFVCPYLELKRLSVSLAHNHLPITTTDGGFRNRIISLFLWVGRGVEGA